MTHDGTIIPCLVSFGVPYIDIEDPRCKPRPATVPGKGSYVQVVDREGKQGKKLVIVRTIGTQKERAQAHNLDIANLAPDESSDPDEDYME